MHPQAANTVSIEAAPAPRIVLTVEQAAESLGIGLHHTGRDPAARP